MRTKLCPTTRNVGPVAPRALAAWTLSDSHIACSEECVLHLEELIFQGHSLEREMHLMPDFSCLRACQHWIPIRTLRLDYQVKIEVLRWHCIPPRLWSCRSSQSIISKHISNVKLVKPTFRKSGCSIVDLPVPAIARILQRGRWYARTDLGCSAIPAWLVLSNLKAPCLRPCNNSAW